VQPAGRWAVALGAGVCSSLFRAADPGGRPSIHSGTLGTVRCWVERNKRRRGLTWVDVVAVVVVLGLIGVVLLPLVGRRTSHSAGHLKDSTQIRGVHQGMVIWAESHDGRYPLPSLADKGGTTIAGADDEKDTTANMISLMIFNGFISPDLCVSVAESNPAIRVFDKYQYTDPSGAADPKKALWDPGFRADFTTGEGNFSYAHAVLWGERKERWRQSFDAGRPIIGNRGPEIAGVAKKKAPEVKPTLVNPKSKTLLIHGPRDTWEGNIAYDDNHVNFETSLAPEGVLYKDAEKKEWRDTLFFDEADDPTGLNAMLGIVVKCGKAKEDWKLIWD